MRLLVTGGAGFIGSNLVRAALADDSVPTVRVLDDLSTGDPRNLDGLEAEVVVGSLLDGDCLEQAVAGVDTVIHLAALPSVPRSLDDPVSTHAANATGTLLLLEACRRSGVHHVAVASSSSVYGSNPALPKAEDDWLSPVSPYAVSKLATESYACAYGDSFGLPTIAFRFFNVYGPFQLPGHAYAAVIPTFVDSALRGEPLTVHGDGLQTRDFTYVGSVVDVLLDAALRRVRSRRPVNLAFGGRHSLLQVIGLLEQLLDRSISVQHVPGRSGDVRHSQAASKRLRQLFPAAAPVALADGLRQTIEWHVQRQESAMGDDLSAAPARSAGRRRI